MSDDSAETAESVTGQCVCARCFLDRFVEWYRLLHYFCKTKLYFDNFLANTIRHPSALTAIQERLVHV